MNINRNDRGFTLIELMFGLLIAMIVIAASFTILTTTSKAVRANDQAVDTQQNARIAMDLIVGDIKVAGFGLTQQGTATQIGGCTNLSAGVGGPYPIIPIDHTTSGSGADRGADKISLVVPTTDTLWKLQAATGNSGFKTITLPSGGGTSMANAGLSTAAAATAMISINGTVSAQVQSRSGDTLTLLNTVTAPAQFPAGTPIYLLQCIRYEIGTAAACGSNGPCLMRGTVAPDGTTSLSPVVDGIEDIQFAYACDGCLGGGVPDRSIDDQGATPSGTFDQADFLTNQTWRTLPMTPDKIRLIQVSVVGRQISDDKGFGEDVLTTSTSSSALQVSDHNHADDAGYNVMTYKQYRRRLLTKTVDTRNVGIEG